MITPRTSDRKTTKGAGRHRSLATLIADGDKVVAERFRTKLCRNFAEKGSCPYESRCMFAHGRHQLRTKRMNLRDGLVNEEAIREFKHGLGQKSRIAANAHAEPVSNARAESANQSDLELAFAPVAQFSTPSPRNATPSSEHENVDTPCGDIASELNSSIVRDSEEAEGRSSPELMLRSLSWYRRNPYDWNNTIVLSPSRASSRASAADLAE